MKTRTRCSNCDGKGTIVFRAAAAEEGSAALEFNEYNIMCTKCSGRGTVPQKRTHKKGKRN